MADEIQNSPIPTVTTVTNKTIDTTVTSNTKDNIVNDGSELFGVSVRGWLAICLVLCVCVACLLKITVTEPLYSLSIAAIGFYMGGTVHKNSNSNQ